MTWAKMLERIEKIKAKDRQSKLNGKYQLPNNYSEADKGETNQIVANKSGFGSKTTYRKAKYISENATNEMIKQLDDGKLKKVSTFCTNLFQFNAFLLLLYWFFGFAFVLMD